MYKKIIKLFSIITFVFLVSCQKNTNIESTFDVNSLKALSDLAVLECKFNNVAKINQPKGTGIWHIGETDRKIFMEYEGQVRIDVDIGEVIEKYDQNSRIITIPKAKIISISDNSFSYKNYISKDGSINRNVVNDDEFKKAITESKLKMQSIVQDNNLLMKRAQVLAESQIRHFISTFGDYDITYVRE